VLAQIRDALVKKARAQAGKDAPKHLAAHIRTDHLCFTSSNDGYSKVIPITGRCSCAGVHMEVCLDWIQTRSSGGGSSFMLYDKLKQTFVATYTKSLEFLNQSGWQGPFVINDGSAIRWIRGCLALEVRVDLHDWAIGEYLCCLPAGDEPGVWAVSQAGKTVRMYLMDFLTERERFDEELQRYWAEYRAMFQRKNRRETLQKIYTVEGFSEVCTKQSELVAAVLRKYGSSIFARARELFGCS